MGDLGSIHPFKSPDSSQKSVLSSLGPLPALDSAGRQQKGRASVGKVWGGSHHFCCPVNAREAWNVPEESLAVFCHKGSSSSKQRGQGWPHPAKGFGLGVQLLEGPPGSPFGSASGQVGALGLVTQPFYASLFSAVKWDDKNRVLVRNQMKSWI